MSLHPRTLSVDEKAKIENEKNISDFQKSKLELEAKKNWDLFYKRNSDHFFKDRHWLTREFKELQRLHEVSCLNVSYLNTFLDNKKRIRVPITFMQYLHLF